MSLRLLLRDRPQRSFAIITETQALVFRHSLSTASADLQNNATSTSASASKCMVEFVPLENIDLTGYRLLRSAGVYGTLGFINISADVFLCVISGAVRIATVRPNETVQRILAVEFCRSLTHFQRHLKDYAEIQRLLEQR